MARAISSALETALGLQHRIVHIELQIEDAAGTLQDHTDAFVSGTIDSTVDELVDQFSFSLERGLSSSSYAPLMTANPPVDNGREVVFKVAVTSHGVTPAAGDYLEIFRGMVVDCDPTENPVQVIAFDQAGILNRAWIEAEKEYGAENGTDLLEEVMQEVLDDRGAGVTLYVPTSPGAFVTPYRQQSESVLQALRTLAESIGWTVRYRWDSGSSAYRLTLYEPDRTKTVADWTMSPSRYLRVDGLRVDIEDVRNRVRVDYFDANGVRQFVVGQDDASVAKYGGPEALPIFMRIQEASDSPIKTQAQAEYIRDAALSDLAEPDATHAVTDFILPHLEVGDLIEFSPNSVHYSSTQTLGVMGVRHDFPSPGVAYTTLTCRGKPSGGVLMWKRRAKRSTETLEQDRVFQISNVTWTEGDLTGDLDWDVGAKIEESFLGYAIVDSPVSPSDWDAVALSVMPVDTGEPPVTLTKPVESSGTAELLLVQIEARYTDPATGDLALGDVHRAIIHPKVSMPAIDPDTGGLAAGSISSLTPFASGIEPVTIETGGSLPATKSTEVILFGGQLYTWTGTQYELLVAEVGTIDTADIAEAAITAQKLADEAVTTVKLALAAVTGDIVAAGAITETKIGDASISTAKLAAGAVTAATIATGTITATQLATDSVTAIKIVANAVTAGKIAANAVTAGKIAALAVTTDKLAANAVTAAKIAAGTITANEIAANTITAGQIAAGAISTDELAANAITAGKLAVGASTGAALNSDPGTSDIDAWDSVAGSTGTVTDVGADGVVGTKALRSPDGFGQWYVFSETRIPVDLTKTYRASAWARDDPASPADGPFYLVIMLLDEAGNRIDGDGVGFWHYVRPAIALTTSFQQFGGSFGAGTAEPFPANAKTMRIGMFLNAGGTTGSMQAQGVRLEEVIPSVLIKDGAVTAAKINVGTLSEISDGLGVVVSGVLRNATSTAAIRLDSGDTLPGTATDFLDLAATGTDPILQAGGVSVLADGTTQVLDSVAKKARLSHFAFRAFASTENFISTTHHTAVTADPFVLDMGTALQLPAGVTITGLNLRGQLGTAGNTCVLKLHSVAADGTVSLLRTLSILTTSEQTVSTSASDVTDPDEGYLLTIEMNYASGISPYFCWADVEYTSPGYRATV